MVPEPTASVALRSLLEMPINSQTPAQNYGSETLGVVLAISVENPLGDSDAC